MASEPVLSREVGNLTSLVLKPVMVTMITGLCIPQAMAAQALSVMVYY